jgi:hypothetical protein
MLQLLSGGSLIWLPKPCFAKLHFYTHLVRTNVVTNCRPVWKGRSLSQSAEIFANGSLHSFACAPFYVHLPVVRFAPFFRPVCQASSEESSLLLARRLVRLTLSRFFGHRPLREHLVPFALQGSLKKKLAVSLARRLLLVSFPESLTFKVRKCKSMTNLRSLDRSEYVHGRPVSKRSSLVVYKDFCWSIYLNQSPLDVELKKSYDNLQSFDCCAYSHCRPV